jgi:hypothetical protein
MPKLKSGNTYEKSVETSSDESRRDDEGNVIFLQIAIAKEGPIVYLDHEIMETAKRDPVRQETLMNIINDAKEVVRRETSQ